MGATISVFLFGGTRTKGHYPTKRVPLGHEAYGSLRAVRKGCVEAELGGLDARLAGRRNARSAHLVHCTRARGTGHVCTWHETVRSNGARSPSRADDG